MFALKMSKIMTENELDTRSPQPELSLCVRGFLFWKPKTKRQRFKALVKSVDYCRKREGLHCA